MSNDAKQSSSKIQMTKRMRRFNALFVATVIVPTLAAVAYFGLIASDVYVSESSFVVRSAQRQAVSNPVGALLQGTGLARTADDTFPVVQYIKSRDALSELNTGGYVVHAYGVHGDIFNRFPDLTRDDTFEALLKYFQRHIVNVELDAASSITTLTVRAFTAEDAHKINEKLLELSEQLVNRMNARAAQDSIQFAQREVNLAAEQAKAAAVRLAAYRNTHTVFDPDRQSALQLQQVSSLQTQLFSLQNQLAQVQSISPANPQVASLKTSIRTVEGQIRQSSAGIVGTKESLSEKAVNYQRLQLDAEFAQKQLTSALSTLELARAEAQRKQLYLERIVQPSTPDSAVEPRRLRGVIAIVILGFIAWGVLSLLISGVKEHRD